MARRRVTDGPSPRLLGDILLTLAFRAQSASPGNPRAGLTAAALADHLRLPDSQARVAGWELARAGCVRMQRVAAAERPNTHAHTLCLPPRQLEHGPGRRVRFWPVALIVVPDLGAADECGRTLRHAGMLPVAVSTCEGASLLLDHFGFELVVVECSDQVGGITPERAARLHQAARAGGCGQFLVSRADASDADLPAPQGPAKSRVARDASARPALSMMLAIALDDRMPAPSARWGSL